MISNEHRLMVREALECKNYATRVSEVATALRDEGVAQIDLYVIFSELQQRWDPSDDRYDSIVDTMDLIYGGPWAKGYDLYPNKLTEAEINRAREG
jgi:hypothetical protein